MLHQITWQAYLLFIAAALLIYYAIIWLTFYRGKTGKLLNRRNTLKPQPETDEIPEDDGLLGEAAEEYGVSTAGSDDLFFGPNEPEETDLEEDRNFEKDDDKEEQRPSLPGETETNADEQELLQAELPDLLEDVKAVFHYFGKHEPGERDRFVNKVIGAIMSYRRLVDSELLPMILADISERALSELEFDVSVTELADKLTRSRDHYKATFGAKR
ncbi:hypothetical protein [Mucilaginibacter paludis]|uniref:Uncharacterized protein n=1 Tax=Mucilaginibacter paludis DSM 18603 TaxID=714943 RepID=H1YIA5_9SPHI|nr:hypothetical protein [Mucilaginibacter paludis]EHQ27518.1 hypothetical protein Mucpa_3419 [Mucilaginibacter paludis DSM 18603]